ncbi:helix-turn-helix domain-containing protein [Kroppenstedtia eburnea]|uniref:Cytoskeleton protein RodZ-like C-terminal domain-containing protein n=1 Tax=Kroppenstedtia eburnea TaxID=714067 RepID=A0A1N7PG48_9BACL|nr:helix-turn-helix domain-containing protein [Kroppenstedtia eburnea]QKI83302.1 helix-turn-helix domain-containing protein [Kroppenstedtia eburnea]SIT09561.1 protein of unknown function [Kroppenstedtia eburnea]
MEVLIKRIVKKMREVVSVWEEIGNQLRQAREQAGLSLEEIRDQTKIDIVSLRALESGDFDKISSPFFVRSHIRAYAKIVGLEPTYLLKKYRPIQEGDNSGLDSTGVINQMTGSWTPVGGGSPDLQNTMIHRRNTETMGTPSAGLPAVSQSGDHGERYDPYRTRHSKPHTPVPDPGMMEESVDPQHGGSSPRPHTGRNHRMGRITETTRQLPALQSHDEDFSSYGEWRTRSETVISPPNDFRNQQSARRSGRHTSVNPTEEVTPSVHAEDAESDLYPEPVGSLPSRSAGALVPYQPPAEDGEGRLSRTAARKAIDISPRAKGAGRWVAKLPKTWAARIAVFAAIVLIPMTAVLAYNSMNKPEEEQAQKQQPSEGGRTNVASTDNNTSSAQVVPVNQGAGFSEYKLSEPSAVELQFKAQDSSWIQIRDQKEANTYLKDFTLKSGEGHPFKLEQGAKTDLWITIGAPQHIEITLNGQPIQAAKSVHIIISDSD